MSRLRALPAVLWLWAWPCFAALAPTGGEFVVKYGAANNEHNPAVGFTAAGEAVIVWTDSHDGVRMKLVDRDRVDDDSERVLVENVHLPAIPGHGTEILNKDPALLVDAQEDAFWLFWTEERQDVIIDFFSEVRVVLDREVRGRRFGLDGQPLGDTVRVNNTIGGFQSRPQVVALRCSEAVAACAPGTFAVAWESDDRAPASSASEGIFARLFDPTDGRFGVQLRLSSPSPAQAVALAAGTRGRFFAAWEAPDKSARPLVTGRFFEANGAPTGKPFVVAATTGGAQRHAAAVWNPASDQVEVFFDRTMPGTGRSRVFVQRVAAPGALPASSSGIPLGDGVVLSAGPTDLAPVAALSGRSTAAVLWTVWKQPYPLALDSCELDGAGARLGATTRLTTYPRFSVGLGTAPDGRLLAVWEGYVFGGRQGLVASWLMTR